MGCASAGTRVKPTSTGGAAGGGERILDSMSGLPGGAEQPLRGEDATEHRSDRDSIPSGYSLDRIPTDEMIHQRSPVNCRYSAQSLANRYELTNYDAAYLELAIRRKFELATTDEALRKAAVKAGVSLVRPA